MKNLLLFCLLLTGSFNYAQWQPAGIHPISDARAHWINIATNKQNEVYIAYQDLGANYGCTVKKLVGNTWTLVGTRGFATFAIRTPEILFDNNDIPYVAFELNGSFEVWKFTGGSWQKIITDPTPITMVVSAIFDKDYNLYYGRTAQTTQNNTLINTPSGLHNLGTGDRPDLAFDDNNVLYAAYTNSSGRTVVRKLNGNNWEFVGPSTGISASSANFLDLVIHDNVPFIAYKDYGISSKAIVKKFNGSSWEFVGPATGVSAGEADWPRMAIDSYGLPYLFFIDYVNGRGATVMKYSGSIWEPVGQPGFTPLGTTGNIMLDNQNRAYVSVVLASSNGSIYTIVASPPPVLPVRLLNFEARSVSNAVQLSWSTASESNNKHFTVERSQRGGSFTAIANVNGAGTTNYISKYSAVDASPLSGHSSYRLKQTDLDGNFTYSEVRWIYRGNGNKITIFPTIATGTFHVLIPKADQFTRIEVYNESGARILHNTAPNTSNTISLKSKGIYFVRVMNRDGVIGREKIVVQ